MQIVRNEAKVFVSATSANLGPGFDSLGMALELRDAFHLRLSPDSALEIKIEGEGADNLPRDETHLVVKAIRHTLDLLGASQAGIRLQTQNIIPQGKGLGSSAAAIVAGIALIKAVISEPEILNNEAMLAIASELEGHPDNVAPAIYGGVTLSFQKQTGEGDEGLINSDINSAGRIAAAQYRAVSLKVGQNSGASFLNPVVITPQLAVSTKLARSLLPAEVPLGAASFNAARSALFAHAIATDPTLLFDATADMIHQSYRCGAMPESYELVQNLRAEGIAAVISGAGPSVLIPGGAPATIAKKVHEMVKNPQQWRIAKLELAQTGFKTVLG